MGGPCPSHGDGVLARGVDELTDCWWGGSVEIVWTFRRLVVAVGYPSPIKILDGWNRWVVGLIICLGCCKNIGVVMGDRNVRPASTVTSMLGA
jgi:hypothetical protein